MITLSPAEHVLVKDAFSLLVGEPLSDMWRYAGYQVFEFGEQVPEVNTKGVEITRGMLSLTSLYWKLRGPNRFSLGSRNFGSSGRRDGHAEGFYGMVEAGALTVETLDVSELGAISLGMSGGFSLDFFINGRVSKLGYQWQYSYRREGSEKRMVLCGGSLDLDFCPVGSEIGGVLLRRKDVPESQG